MFTSSVCLLLGMLHARNNTLIRVKYRVSEHLLNPTEVGVSAAR
jgi:hypothetical protein